MFYSLLVETSLNMLSQMGGTSMNASICTGGGQRGKVTSVTCVTPGYLSWRYTRHSCKEYVRLKAESEHPKVKFKMKFNFVSRNIE